MSDWGYSSAEDLRLQIEIGVRRAEGAIGYPTPTRIAVSRSALPPSEHTKLEQIAERNGAVVEWWEGADVEEAERARWTDITGLPAAADEIVKAEKWDRGV